MVEISDDIKKISAYLSKSMCILAGAGVSYSPPANLPTASHILNELFSTLPILEKDRRTLHDALSPEWEDGIGLFDFLRFEQIMEALDYCGDKHIELLRNIVRKTQPNLNHYQLARLLGAGHLILTTNFDCLIEQACDELGIPYTVIVSNKECEDYLNDATKFVNPIFKLHGSAPKERIEDDSIIATMQTVTTDRNKMASKWAAVDKVLANHDLMVVGYSGSDDFDVAISIRFARGKLLWIQHGANDKPIGWYLSQEKVSLKELGIDEKLFWFFGRMFGDFNYKGKVKRKEEDVLVVKMQTSRILDELLHLHGMVMDESWKKTGIQFGEQANFQFIPVFNARESNLSMFFVSLLFRNIGIFDRALDYLERVANSTDEDLDLIIASRVQATLARIWMERERWDVAVKYMDKTLKLQTRIEKPRWLDAINNMEFSYRLGIPKTIDEDFIDSVEMKDWLTPRQKTHLKRAIHFWEAEEFLSKGKTVEAIEKLSEFYKIEEFPLELQEEAEGRFLYLKIQRAYYWQEVDAQRRNDAAWAKTEESKAEFLLKEAYKVFELLQQKTKWADASFFHAEELMWAEWPDWALEKAFEADIIYNKIGHDIGKARCHALMDFIQEIGSGVVGASHYRPLSIKFEQDAENEIELFCPHCRTITTFHFQHCWKCGWFIASAPISKADQLIEHAERSRRVHELFLRVGLSKLNPGPD